MLQLQGHAGTVHALAFGADSRTLISAGRDTTIRVWDIAAGQETLRLECGLPVLSLALHPKGRALAAGTTERKLQLWDVATGKLAASHGNQMAAITGIAWLSGRTGLAMCSGERMRPDQPGELRLWDFESPKPYQSLRVEERGLWSLAVARQGTLLACSGGAREVSVWEITRQQPRTFRQPSPALAVALSPDGSLLASTCERAVKLWNVDSGHERATLEEHRGIVRALTFSPDGSTLASAGQDQVVRFWRLGAQTLAGPVYQWPTGAVHAVTFSPDGLIAAAAGDSGDVWVWDLDS